MSQDLPSLKSSASVFTLKPGEIHSFWNVIEPLLARVEDRDWVPEGVRAELEGGTAQIWLLADSERVHGLVVTKIQLTSAGKRGLLWIAAGDGLEEGLRVLADEIEPWFREMGCTSVQVLGRRGWLRVLPDYKDVGVVLTKAL